MWIRKDTGSRPYLHVKKGQTVYQLVIRKAISRDANAERTIDYVGKRSHGDFWSTIGQECRKLLARNFQNGLFIA